MNNEEKDLDTRCPYHCNEKIGQCNNPSPDNKYIYCFDYKDCIYKQYARKEQECEKAKQNAQDTYDLWQALIESFNILQGEKIKLEQECEELKKQLMQKSEVDMFFNTPVEGWSNDPCGICPHKAENEQLKEELSVIQYNCNREGCKYYDDNTFKVFYECKAQKALQLNANSITTKYCDLLQTLAEIKDIITTSMEQNTLINLDKILQKINERENAL